MAVTLCDVRQFTKMCVAGRGARTRALQAGSAASRSWGAGFVFDQLDRYVPGDDVRSIDWKSSARCGQLMSRRYHQERLRRVHIFLDASSSMAYGERYMCAARIACGVAWACVDNGDHVWVHIHNDTGCVTKTARTRADVAHLITTVNANAPCPKGRQDGFGAAVRRVLNQYRFWEHTWVISDWIASSCDPVLYHLAARGRVHAVRVDASDSARTYMSRAGMGEVDSEDVSSSILHGQSHSSWIADWRMQQEHDVISRGIYINDIRVGGDYVTPIVRHLHEHM